MSSLTVWGGHEPPPPDFSDVVTWESFLSTGANATQVSLPQTIKENREDLRSRYQDLVLHMGARHLQQNAHKRQIMIRPSLNYWWMTLPTVYSLDPNSSVYNAVRLLAFTDIFHQRGYGEISLIGLDAQTIRILKSWARDCGVQINEIAHQRRNSQSTLRERISGWLYMWAPPLCALRFFLRTRGIQSPSSNEKRLKTNDILVIDYLISDAAMPYDETNFHSEYWGPLTPEINAQNTKTWLHLPAEQPVASVLRRNFSRLINCRPDVHERHDLFFSQISLKTRVCVLRDFCRIVLAGLLVRPSQYCSSITGLEFSLAEVFRQNHRDLWFGREAMKNSFYLNLFDEYLAALPTTSLGLYPFENQPWEIAFVDAWKRRGHGELVGFAHSSIVFWDTRVLQHRLTLQSASEKVSMPRPDTWAYNSPEMEKILTDAHFPKARLNRVEALRYMTRSVSTRRPAQSLPRILLLGEYSEEASTSMIILLACALDQLSFKCTAFFRAHPASATQAATLPPGVSVDKSRSLSEALEVADFVVCGSMSSVSLDAYIAKKDPILILDGRSFISSPGESMGPTFVATCSELVAALEHQIKNSPCDSRDLSHLVFRDPSLPEWKSVFQRSGF